MSYITRRAFLGATGVLSTLGLASCGCSNDEVQGENQGGNPGEEKASSALPTLDTAAWQYNADDDVYYQVGIGYCAAPADQTYEKLAIFVPGAYFEASDNGNGTFTCTLTDAKSVGNYTATTAPIVMPVNTPGYAAQNPLTSYGSFVTYTSQGFVYVHAGCRGRDAGAPAGVVDLKAAVRFLRASSKSLAGSVDRIFTFGMSGGGAQSALMGATGDSDLYAPYLTAIGAAADVSDSVYGSMAWCPITGLDVGDASYEWMMGHTREGLSTEDQAVVSELTHAFATYINAAGLVDEGGAALALEESEGGRYQAGSYYQCVLRAIETSLNDFLADTAFPYEASPGSGPQEVEQKAGDVPDGAPTGEATTNGNPDDGMNGMGPAVDGSTPGARRGAGGPEGIADAAVMLPRTGEETDFEAVDNIERTQNSGGVVLSGTYETAAGYIAALNANEEWVAYDEATNTVTITSVAAFCSAFKRASKALGAFDQFDRGQGENTLFGVEGKPAHFDAILAGILQSQNSAYAADYASDLQLTDAQGTSMQARVNMYTPLYYLLATQEGNNTSVPAKRWRIRSGINQGDTALTTELNLALALKADTRVESVDFATVWGQGHTMAERTGSADENFIAWVNGCFA